MITFVGFLIASGCGAVARGLTGQFANEHGGGLAYGTFAVNVVGSFALGALHHVSPAVATVVGVGFLGSFTTFSSFSRDVVALVEVKQLVLASGYLVITLIACVGAAALGLWCS